MRWVQDTGVTDSRHNMALQKAFAPETCSQTQNMGKVL